MAWSTSDRRSRLPSNWRSLRSAVLKRDGYRCVWIEKDDEIGKVVRCRNEATEVDHIQRGDNHDIDNLRSLCHDHHARKTGWESAQANAAKRKAVRNRLRRNEQNPSLNAELSTAVPAAPLFHRSSFR